MGALVACVGFIVACVGFIVACVGALVACVDTCSDKRRQASGCHAKDLITLLQARVTVFSCDNAGKVITCDQTQNVCSESRRGEGAVKAWSRKGHHLVE